MLVESSKIRHIDSLCKIYLYTIQSNTVVYRELEVFFTFRLDECFNLLEILSISYQVEEGG